MALQSPSGFSCFAAVTPGLEPVAIAEATALGFSPRAEDGGFGFTGNAYDIIRANTLLTIPSRIIARLAEFNARSFIELERHARRVPWTRVIRSADTVAFRVTCKKSKLYHSDAVAERLAKALERAVPGVRIVEGGASDEDAPASASDAHLIVVRMFRDDCTISVDTSGELLHRRGYRQEIGKAPLRETFAAAMLAAAEWDRVSPLVDPMCGSGTICIEAARLARCIAPGVNRTTAIERWPGVDAQLGEKIRKETAAGMVATAPTIVGSDRDAGVIAAAKANALRAGVHEDVSFAVHSISASQFPDVARGWVVTNPPYGVRTADQSKTRDLWAQFGKVLHDRARGWRVCILSPSAALESQIGIPLRVLAKSNNGGIPVRIVVGDVPA